MHLVLAKTMRNKYIKVLDFQDLPVGRAPAWHEQHATLTLELYQKSPQRARSRSHTRFSDLGQRKREPQPPPDKKNNERSVGNFEKN